MGHVFGDAIVRGFLNFTVVTLSVEEVVVIPVCVLRLRCKGCYAVKSVFLLLLMAQAVFHTVESFGGNISTMLTIQH